MNNYNVLISQEDNFFVAKNIELGIVSQGKNINEAMDNIKEATQLYLEDDDVQVNNTNSSFLTTISV